jgi:excisionase family DNA binding protein
MDAGPLGTRFISGAVVSGGPAWLISRILASPHVAKLLNHPPAWIERGDLTDTVRAIELAGRAFEVSLTAPERGKTTTLSAGTAQSEELTTREAANRLGMSQRRVQELAAALGGRRVGREWRLPETAVRQYEKQAGKRRGG